ncbi:nicotinate-nucleotide diphosphorylase [Naegleria gruberi]|uniref:Nicotinate-nucleotide pyrophosphorylase [carboxylating] n=1 Tax=Naegleria gruberi TaxID=5762 RepID=D2V8S0_NAEGR|nr:nicotinate-nucleotide diphosphorylase [Naegleria gruberi]EFC46739.1 nicotinate-nucleotide diphosphorylase [Naegleria gruberi]|eukprot:XP_002679483.1 nicotinate-nucleotide diphosphorylase [Naegleria gruberi strain NEG-M]
MLPPRKLLVQKLTSYIEEDIPAFDVSAAIVGDSIKTSTIFYKKSNNDFNSDTLPIIMSGIPILTVLFEDCFPNLKVNWLVGEGDNLNDEATISNLLKLYGSLKYPTQSQCEKKLKVPIAIVEGPVYQLLQVERLCLNILSHLTGISSISRKVQNLVLSEIEKNGAKFRGEIAATRKTTPGLRHFEKYAVMVGGCKPHRMDLSQMVMLKDNHVDACGGSISKCVKRARSLCGCNTQKIEVECRSLQDAREAAQAGADIVMLDNFNAVQARDASDVLVKEFPNLVIEVSGGLNPETVLEYLKECSNVHVLSMGILTEGGGIKVDFSMKITETTQ